MSLDFIGGLVTGEGCFALGISNGWRGVKRITPIFQLKMNDHETMMWLERSLRHYGLGVYFIEGKQANGTKWYRVRASGNKQLKLYTDLLVPHLSGSKRDAAETVQCFVNLRLADERPDKKGRSYSRSEINLVRVLREVNGNRDGKKNDLRSLESSETKRLAPV